MTTLIVHRLDFHFLQTIVISTLNYNVGVRRRFLFGGTEVLS